MVTPTIYGRPYKIIIKYKYHSHRFFDPVTAALVIIGCYRSHNGYAGPTIRLRRDSDNVEQDFYGDYLGNMGFELDATGEQVLTWLDGATPFVHIWYDQSGNGINVLQATTAQQPSIITSGTINTYSGKPTMYFNASNTGGVYFQSATSYQLLNNTPYTLSAVCQTPSGGSGTHNTAIGTGNSGAQNRSLNFGYNSTNGNVLKIGQGGNTSSFAQIPQNTKLTLLTGIRNNTGGASAFLNGNASGSSQMSNPGTSPTYSTQYLATNSTTDYLNIGAGYTPGAYDWIGNISEVILFKSILRKIKRSII
jgi:hypothetical protein